MSVDEPPAEETPDIESGDDDAKPDPPSQPVPSKVARQGIRDPKEETGDGPGVVLSDADIGGQTLSRFLTYYPFMRFFCWIAHRQFPAAHKPETRVASPRKSHPRFYGLCVFFDFLFVLLATLLLVAAAAIALYKTIWLGVAAPELTN